MMRGQYPGPDFREGSVMVQPQLCISADSHVVESAEFFLPLQTRFGDQAPRMVTVHWLRPE